MYFGHGLGSRKSNNKHDTGDQTQPPPHRPLARRHAERSGRKQTNENFSLFARTKFITRFREVFMSAASKNVVICQGAGSLKNDAGTQTGTVTLTPKKLIFAPSKQGEPHITVSSSRICGEFITSGPLLPQPSGYSTAMPCHH